MKMKRMEGIRKSIILFKFFLN